MSLTILIPTLPQRHKSLANVLQQISNQIGEPLGKQVIREKNYTITIYDHDQVKVIVCFDQQKMTVGKKRNILKSLVQSDYFTYIDDDDEISKDYFSEILAGIKSGKDLITYKVQMFSKGKLIHNVLYHPRFTKDFNVPATPKQDEELKKALEGKSKSWRTRIINRWAGTANRIPNHLMVWRTAITKDTYFPDVNIGEDGAWAKTMKPRVKSLYEIDKVLYNYLFDYDNTETQNNNK